MKRTLLTLALLAATPLLTGCEIRQSYGYNKNRPCGCHGPKHHDHCSYGQKHRPPRNGSHDPHIPPRPDRGYDFYSPRAASSEINTLDHR